MQHSTNTPPDTRTYKPFTPEDYPAYSFAEDGTPHRIVPVSRGRYTGFTGPLSFHARKSDGAHIFGLTRPDGSQQNVSRSTILKAIGQTHRTTESRWDWEAEGYRQINNGFNDYIANDRGTVYRINSPLRGHYRTARNIHAIWDKKSRYWFLRMQDDGGTWRRMNREQVLEAAGFRAPTFAARHRHHVRQTSRPTS